jgi:hypothetical protein
MSPKSKRLDRRSLDTAGRPVIYNNLRPFKDPTGNCCNVLYALARTTLLGNKLGLSKRSIRMLLQRLENDAGVEIGTREWLLTNLGHEDAWIQKQGKLGTTAIKNAITRLRTKYPIVVLKLKAYSPIGSFDRSKGGHPADIFDIDSTTLGWPCGAQIMKLLTSGIYSAYPLRYSHLAEHIHYKHRSHAVPDALKGRAKPPKIHTLRNDIEFLVRTRYMKLFTHEKGHPRRKEIPHTIPFHFKSDSIIELEERSAWESVYFERLSQHFINEEV